MTQDGVAGIDPDIKDAMEGHERFRQQFERDRAFYEALATKKQKPRILWIGCADSRVVPATITNADPGELFEIRNIANVVPPADAAEDTVGAAIEYGVVHLGIDEIVVCGHTGCGGIAALLEPGSSAGDQHLGRWLQFTRPAHQLIAAARIPAEERLTATIKAHVQFQLDNLMSYPIVRERVADGRLNVHGWIYDMHTGELSAYDPEAGGWRGLLG
jgi:carbonic anhydrase